MLSTRSQTIIIWWGLAFILIYGLSLGFLLKMVPLPSAHLSAAAVAAFYTANAFQVRLGAVICSYSSAFMVPLSVVIYVQMARLEKGVPIWSILQLAGGCMMSIFLVLPPLFWGVAAFTPSRPPEITLIMHELANLTLTTTDQYYIFQMVAIAVVSLTQKSDPHSAFPRWMGYFTIWAAIMFEAGAIAFLFKSGPFAWNGLFVFWSPFSIFGAWFFALGFTVLRALKHQAGLQPA
ncbi:hypothetical protein GCM10010909_28430 [Acidocella aquatica]|uniref:DUF4386 domain-containing protein n=1 Tax=Acidocella aquatica TaxID=1922313 RepID=A0ABQ6A8U1_9PROT|nr:hypothetical protein [Acidocella aquatica]GLR68162.1 hypothetical protein GCM10010909_28430 [Acidocella aquatica]